MFFGGGEAILVVLLRKCYYMEIFIVRHSTHLHTKEDSCRNKVELLIHLVIILSK